MSDPLIHAFFVGRAVAEALNEALEKTVTNAFSELGKFDAEQRERLRQFTIAVMDRANQATATVPTQGTSSSTTSRYSSASADLQATIDELRAEIAQVRVQLQRYRTGSL